MLSRLPIRVFPAELGLHVATRFSGLLSKHLLSFSLTFHLHDRKAVSFFFGGFSESLDSSLFFFQVQFTLGKAELVAKLPSLFEVCPLCPGRFCKW